MRKNLVILFSFILGGACVLGGKYVYCWVKEGKIKKQSKKDPLLRGSYLSGYKLGKDAEKIFKEKQYKKTFLVGVYDSLKGRKVLVDIEDIKTSDNKKQGKAKKGKNMEAGKKFLEENRGKEGVKETSSGLQYKVLKEGSGKSPSATDTVEVHYRGTLIDGTEFDSSYKRNQSISFPLNGVIKGWTEGLQLMKEGAEYEFYIPSELGYGPAGTPSIPPNSVLIFKVELIKVM